MSAMIEEKLRALGCEAWELTETRETRWEFYFIGHKLDQNRSVAIHSTEVTVYEKSADGAFLGSASDVISPTASEADVDRILAGLRFQASLVKNPCYTLTSTPVSVENREEPVDVAAIAKDFIRAFDAVPETPVKRLNSYEIHVSGFSRRTLNSNGVAYTCTYPATLLDVVVNAKREGHEVEIYRLYRSGSCDGERLQADVARIMTFAEDRLDAKPTPKLGTGTVLLSTEDAVEVYRYFAAQVQADYVVRRISSAEIGKPLMEDVTGDAITLTALPYLPNSSLNTPVDREGNEVRKRILIADGMVEGFWGSRQFSQYLGLEQSSLLTNAAVGGGSQTEAELRRQDYLEVVEFSSFDVDPMSGDIAGEIRLGYHHHDGVTDIVTGGSVSGSLAEAAKGMRMSKETVQYDRWQIPAVTLLPGLRIAGA